MTVALTGRLICITEAEAARVRAHLPEHIRLTRAGRNRPVGTACQISV